MQACIVLEQARGDDPAMQPWHDVHLAWTALGVARPG